MLGHLLVSDVTLELLVEVEVLVVPTVGLVSRQREVNQLQKAIAGGKKTNMIWESVYCKPGVGLTGHRSPMLSTSLAAAEGST